MAVVVGMPLEEARYVKRRVKSGTIDVHPTETALVVNYELEAVVLAELEKPILREKKDYQKIIRLKSLNPTTDCAALARDVVQKCNLISSTKLAEVEHLIYYLQNRKETAFSGDCHGIRPGSACESPCPTTFTSGEKAIFANLEQYIELLYEDIPEKVQGSALILQLAQDTNNLGELSKNEAVLSALSRVLREDWRRSIELSTNIVYTFFCFSMFSDFHALLLQYKVGSLCLAVVDYEFKRHAQLKSELEMRLEKSVDASVSPTPASAPVSKLPLPKSARSKPVGIIDPRRRSPGLTPPADENSTNKSGVIVSPRAVSSNTMAAKISDEEATRKFGVIVKKQDQLLRVCFYLLLHLSENVRVEDKMRKRHIVGLLIQALEHYSTDLLALVVTFLTKLACFKENKDDMANLNIIEKLPKLLLLMDTKLESNTLLLLFNLSFDTKLREKMVRSGFLPKLVSLLNCEHHREVVLKILYHMSMDDRVKAMFAFTDCVPKVNEMILRLDPEMDQDFLTAVALMINIVINPRCAEMMTDLRPLMERAFQLQSSVVMKIIRNTSAHASTKHLLVDFVGDLAGVLTRCENEDFVIECVGILANLTLPDLNYSQLLDEYRLVPWILDYLVPDKHQDDLVLQVVLFVRTCATDEACARFICKADVLISLIEVLKAKQEDDELVLQILCVFYEILHHSTTRSYVIKKTEAAAYLTDLMGDSNKVICKVVDACLKIIKSSDEKWAEHIKTKKFEIHNSNWLSMVQNNELDMNLQSLADIDEPLPQYNLLEHSLLLQDEAHGSMSGGDDIEIVSTNPLSEDGSRPVSRHGLDIEELISTQVLQPQGEPEEDMTNEEVVRDALMNLVISEDTLTDNPRQFRLGTLSHLAAQQQDTRIG